MWTGGYKLWFFWTHSISRWMYSVSKVKSSWDCSVVIELHSSSKGPEFCPQYPYQHFITAYILHPGDLIPSSGLHRYLNSCAHTYTQMCTQDTQIKIKWILRKKKELDVGWTCPLQSGNSSRLHFQNYHRAGRSSAGKGTNPTNQIQFQNHVKLKERTYTTQLFSDLHTYTVASISVNNNNKWSNL